MLKVDEPNLEKYLIINTLYGSIRRMYNYQLQEREKVMAAGCNDYITKPISKKLLMMLLDKYFKSAS